MDTQTEAEVRAALLKDPELRHRLKQLVSEAKMERVGSKVMLDNRLEKQLIRSALGVLPAPPSPQRSARLFRSDTHAVRTGSAFTEEVVTRAWVAYQGGASIRAVARELWESLGYRSAESCAVVLTTKFKDRGYELRPRKHY